MREQCTSISKYDSKIAEYIDTHQAYDFTDGNVEAPTGWFGLAGRNVIVEDERGFVSTHKFATRIAARTAFDDRTDEYSMWLEGDE